jgi:S1-C subfamily serine protease
MSHADSSQDSHQHHGEPLSLMAVSEQLAGAVAHAAQAVVAVHAREKLASTGVHWRDGLIVTTDATVRREQNITVTIPDGRRVAATLVGRDAASDLAVLRVESGATVPAARVGDPSTLRPGHLVLAVARLDDSGPRVSFGAVSAVGGAWRTWKGGEYTLRIQSGVALYPGFGGSPLVDAAGHVHGINSGGLSQQLATTIPADTVERVVSQLVATGYVPRGWLGAALQAVRVGESAKVAAQGREGGLLIIGLADGGPAATSGLFVGDIVLALDGAAVNQPHDVLDVLQHMPPGRAVSFDVLRGGVFARVIVTIGERPGGHEYRRTRRAAR